MAKRSSSSTKKSASKKAAPARKAAGKKTAAPAKKAAGARKTAAGKTAARKTAGKKAAPAKKASAARKVKVAAPIKKPAAPPKKAKATAPVKKPAKKKPGPARRAAAAVKTVARTAASVVMAPVKAVAAVVAGPAVESPPESAERRDEEGREGASNGVDARAGDEEDAGEEEEGAGAEVMDAGAEEMDAGAEASAFESEEAADPDALIDRIEAAYNVSLPERYRRFLLGGEYQRYPRIELAGYIRGPYDMDFLDDLLADVAELGQNAGIYDMDDVPWSDEYQGYVPLASLSHPEVDEPKVFLVHQVTGDQHRVLLFDYEGWKLYPLADSFDSFLANLPRAINDLATSFRPGQAA